MFRHALRSLWNRRFVALLTVLSVAMSVALILGVERLRGEARDSFTNSASGLDLIVAPRGNPVQILMATVFGVGTTGTGLAWETYERVAAVPQVAWALPLQMGDNHRGFPVIGTRAAYFHRFRHSGGRPLALATGRFFEDDESDAVVVGAEVAARFGYTLGTVIVNAHGAGAVSFDLHDDAPFTIAGILAPTGTAVDRMLFVSLQGFEQIHAERTPPQEDPFELAVWPTSHLSAREKSAANNTLERHADEHGEHERTDHDGASAHDDAHGDVTAAEERGNNAYGVEDVHADHQHEPATINAIYVGLVDRTAVLGVQRALAELRTDPVSAVLPGVALAELWSITGAAERAMQAMSWAVALAGMIGMVVMLSAALDARRREFAILRSVGATPGRIFGLIVTEAGLLMGAGILAGLAVLALAVRLSSPLLSARFGLNLDLGPVDTREIALLFAIFGAGLAASLVPAIRVYRLTLADGLSVRL